MIASYFRNADEETLMNYITYYKTYTPNNMEHSSKQLPFLDILIKT